MRIRQRTVMKVRVFGLSVSYIGSFLIWLVSGFERGGAIGASYVVLVGLAIGAWTYWIDGELSKYTPGILAHAMVPAGVLAWAYMGPRQWAWVPLSLWLASFAATCIRHRRLTLGQLVAVLTVGQGVQSQVGTELLKVLCALEIVTTLGFFISIIAGVRTADVVIWLIAALFAKAMGLVIGKTIERRQRHSF